MGTPLAAVPMLERILRDGHRVVAVWTQPDKPAGRGNKLAVPPVKEFALQNDLPVFQPAKIKTAESIETFRSHEADAAVVVAYGRILPETFLDAFPKGAINVHFSLLPKYRGAAPVNWAIANGETRTGVTTMQMDAGLDTGGILLQREIKIGKQENAVELMQRLATEGADLLSETLAMINELVPQPQNHDEASFAPILKKEFGQIDWNLSADEISNRVRGFQPFPTSYSFFGGKKITIWKAKSSDQLAVRSQQTVDIGRIIEAKKDRFFVACGENTVLEIIELQAEGKKRMTARDFLNGNKIEVGDKFE